MSDLLRCTDDLISYFAQQDELLSQHRTTYEQQLASDVKHINQIQDTVSKVTSTITSMTTTLHNFENRLTELSNDLSELNQRSIHLTETQAKLDKKLESLTSFNECFTAAERLATTLENLSPDIPLDEYCSLLDRMQHMELFLKEHSSFAGALKILSRYKAIETQELPTIKTHVSNLLSDVFSSTILASKPRPDSPNFSPLIVSQNTEEWGMLQKMCIFLENRNHSNFIISSLLSLRSVYLENAFSMLDLHVKGSFPPPSTYYQLKDHPVHDLLPKALELLSAEITVSISLISRSFATKYAADLVKPFLNQILTYLKDLFGSLKLEACRTTDWRVCNRLLVLIDIFALYRKVRPKLQSINAESGQQFQSDFSEIHSLMTSVPKSALNSFTKDLTDERFYSVSKSWLDPKKHTLINHIPNDGSISWVTIELVNTLKILSGFDDKLISELCKRPGVTLGSYFESCLDFVINWISKMFESEKERSLLLFKVFVVNNYGYIKDHINEESEFASFISNKFRNNFDQKFRKLCIELTEVFKSYWSITDCLKSVMSISPSDEMSKNDRRNVKTAFNMFNSAIEERCFGSFKPIIFDCSIRDDVATAIIPVIQSHFKDFLDRFESCGFSQNKHKYLKYSVESLGQLLQQYFSDSPNIS
ncbi:hypothetical protein P9112_012310 [Eukaryota sp. TZLM1-RC]